MRRAAGAKGRTEGVPHSYAAGAAGRSAAPTPERTVLVMCPAARCLTSAEALRLPMSASLALPSGELKTFCKQMAGCGFVLQGPQLWQDSAPHRAGVWGCWRPGLAPCQPSLTA